MGGVRLGGNPSLHFDGDGFEFQLASTFSKVHIPADLVSIISVFTLVGCGGGEGAESTAVGEPTAVPVSSPESMGTAAATAISTAVFEAEEPEPATGAEGEGDSKVELLYRITRNRVTDPGNEDAVAAIREIGESGDGEFVVGLADIIQTPLTRDELLFNVEQVIPVMQRLSGQGIEYDGKAWVEWVAQQPGLDLPEGYFGWKVDLLSNIDPRFRDYFTIRGQRRAYGPGGHRPGPEVHGVGRGVAGRRVGAVYSLAGGAEDGDGGGGDVPGGGRQGFRGVDKRGFPGVPAEDNELARDGQRRGRGCAGGSGVLHAVRVGYPVRDGGG